MKEKFQKVRKYLGSFKKFKIDKLENKSIKCLEVLFTFYIFIFNDLIKL